MSVVVRLQLFLCHGHPQLHRFQVSKCKQAVQVVQTGVMYALISSAWRACVRSWYRTVISLDFWLFIPVGVGNNNVEDVDTGPIAMTNEEISLESANCMSAFAGG
jgi:hypothetical protein